MKAHNQLIINMKNNISLVALFGMTSGFSSAAVLFSDNFNTPDTGNLDLSDQTGRRAGLVPTIQVRSSRVQHGIAGNQLNFLSVGSGRIRFHDDSDNDVNTAGGWHDWAAGAGGASILGEGTLRIEFDWSAGNDTSTNWVSVNFGHNAEGAGEPAMRVNDGGTDIGMLFRFNGETELFDNGANLGAQGSFTPSVGVRHVSMEYTFGSFADGTSVSMVANVDGTQVYSGTGFTLDSNGGALHLELGTNENTMIDNLVISSVTVVPEPTSIAMLALGGLGLLRRRRRG